MVTLAFITESTRLRAETKSAGDIQLEGGLYPGKAYLSHPGTENRTWNDTTPLGGTLSTGCLAWLQTLCAISHFDFRRPGAYSYEQAFATIDASSIIEQVDAAINKFPFFAHEAGVPKNEVEFIMRLIDEKRTGIVGKALVV